MDSLQERNEASTQDGGGKCKLANDWLNTIDTQCMAARVWIAVLGSKRLSIAKLSNGESPTSGLSPEQR